MTLKLLDIEYLRSQMSSSGQVLVTGSSFAVRSDGNLVVSNGRIGVGTTLPTQRLTVNGNLAITGPGSVIFFPDGSQQVTAAVTAVPGGNEGSVQYKSGSVFAGSLNLHWDQVNSRLGVGTDAPKATFQIIDVGYESTNHSTSTTDDIVIDLFPVVDYRSCHYIVQVTDANFSWFHTTQIMLIHDGLNAYKSEYNIVTTQEKLGSFDCRVSSGNVELVFSPFYSSDKNIKVIRTSIEP